MSPAQQILLVMGGLAVLAVLLRFYRRSVKWAVRAAVHSVAGLACLIAYDLISVGITGVAGVGVSLQNALIVGLLGAPGFAMLAAFPWIIG
jgi:inhibitor of the pro-sigma K processing machinery